MNIQTLLNHLTTGGFTLEQFGDDGLKVLGPKLSPLKSAIREHKSTLRQLACIPLAELERRAEREAIQWADTLDADAALEDALIDWDSPEAHPPPCECGSLLVRYDVQGNRHCMKCDPGQSQRVAALAKQFRETARKRRG